MCIGENIEYIQSCMKGGKNCSYVFPQLLLIRRLGVSVLLVGLMTQLVSREWPGTD